MSTRKPPITTVKLEYTYEHDGKTYDRLLLRKMKFKDMDCLDLDEETGELKTSVAGIRRLIAALADAPQEVIDELYEEDVLAVGKALAKKKKKAAKKSSTPSTGDSIPGES